jgi:uncharacterized protein
VLIRVFVTPNAKQARVVGVSEGYFEVWVDEKAVGGRANKRLLEILSEHFNIPKSKITILKGTKTRNKTIQIMLEPKHDCIAQSIIHASKTHGKLQSGQMSTS